MKKYLVLLMGCTMINLPHSFSQNLGIGTLTPDSNAILEIASSSKGILIPRTSSSSRISIPNPPQGLILYDTTTKSFWFHNGIIWAEVAAGNNGWNLNGNSNTDTGIHFLGTTDQKPLRFRLNNTWNGELNPLTQNYSIGDSAGLSITSGMYNTVLGARALVNNSTGGWNTAIGSKSLNANSIGYANTAIGESTLLSNEAGVGNSALGYSALYTNKFGSYNTAIGFTSLYNNFNGGNNSATGVYSLYYNTTGSNNTAMGYSALTGNTSGGYNTGIGVSALQFDSNGTYNTAIGAYSLYSNRNGSNNTALGYGTLYYSTGSNNTALGYATLYNNSTGSSNTGLGYSALRSNTTGSFNSAIGYVPLYFNTTGYDNTANGYASLYSNISGYNNTATGLHSLYSNTIGYSNSATGFQALFTNTSGTGNTADGSQSLYLNGNGYDNTSLGRNSMFNNVSGYNNTAVGREAMNWNVSGVQNTAVGVQALMNTTGNENTAIGIAALAFNITGYRNTAIGGGADFTYSNLYNSTVIGYGARVDDFNKVRVGDVSVLSIGGHVGWSTFSDGRYKQQVLEDVKGLAFIKLLRPVTYIIDLPGLNNYFHPGEKNVEMDSAVMEGQLKSIARSAIHRESGFIAQEVEVAANKTGFTFSGVDKPTNTNALYGLRYSDFVVPLVKAMQEQQQIIESQGQQIKIIKEEYATQVRKMNEKIETLVKAVEALAGSK